MRVNGKFGLEFAAKNDGYHEVKVAPNLGRDLLGNFIDVIRGGGRLYCNADLGAATMVAIKLAVEAYRQEKTLAWDRKRERVGV